MDRRDFLQSVSLCTVGLLVPISASIIIEPQANARAISLQKNTTTTVSKVDNGCNIFYTKMDGGEHIADIYGFSPDSDKFEKIIFNSEFDINDPFHIIYSEYLTDEDGERTLFTCSKKNIVLTNYTQVDKNVFTNVGYDTNPSAAKRLEYKYKVETVETPHGRKDFYKLCRVPNSDIYYKLNVTHEYT